MRRLVIVTAALLVACSAPPGGPAPRPSSPDPTPTPTPPVVSPTPTPTASGPGRFETAPPLPEPRQPDPQGTPVPVPEDRLAAIRADLADRGVAGDDLVVISSRSVTWNDGSLGCPEPGMAYTQALVPGMHVVVAVGETQYDYRFGAGTVPRLCVPLPLR